MKFYTAGGAVRDLLLGKPPRDVDFAFAGTQEAFLEIMPQAQKVNKGTQTVWIADKQEFVRLRGDSPADDILQRDFTINALLLDQYGFLYTHAQTFHDLTHKIIRPVSATSLADDPVRVFRAARFLATMPSFTAHESCNAQMHSCATTNKLQNIPAEQVSNELRKSFVGEKPGNFIRLLAKNNCFEPWFTELANAQNIPAGPEAYHSSSLLEHIAKTMDEVASFVTNNTQQNAKQVKLQEMSTWLALCHDLGKADTPQGLLPHHYKHEQRGEALAKSLALRLKMPTAFLKAGALAAKLHMQAGNYYNLRSGTKVDLIKAIPQNALEPMAILACVDAKDRTLYSTIMEDAMLLNKISLPEKYHNLGEKSGQILHQIRTKALAKKHA